MPRRNLVGWRAGLRRLALLTIVMCIVGRGHGIADQNTRTAALASAIRQNTRGDSEGKPAGVPASWSWYQGKNGALSRSPAPEGFSAMTGWGIVYPIQSQTNATSRVFIRNFVSYVHLTDGKWVSVQDQAIMPMGGAHFAAAFSGKQLPLSSNQKRPDGAWEIESPPAGYNDHFWPDERGHFDPGTVDGVFVQFDIRTDNPAAHLVAAPGADYWRDATAQSIGSTDTATNRGLGTANFTRLSTQWQTLYYYSLSTDQIEADLPPPLAGAAVPISDKRR